MMAFASCRRAACASAMLFMTAFFVPASAQPDPVTVDQFNLPAQDAQGWTVLTPSADSRLVYVDPVNGSDADGTVYQPGASEVGADPQAPVGAVLAVKTLARANALIRDDQPDWILLKAGGIWTGESLNVKRGRSASQRAVVCAYGGGARPELRTGRSRAIVDDQMVNIVIQGIRFWAHTRDKDGPHFTGYEGTVGFGLYTREDDDIRQVRDVLIEDCVFRSYTSNVLTGNIGIGNVLPVTRFVLRRCLISKNYTSYFPKPDDQGHAQGLYHSGYGQPLQPSILLQENTFDHNGWRMQSVEGESDKMDGQATIFNHNTYFTSARGVIFQRNLFLRPSSIGNKWTSQTNGGSRGIVLDDNLYAEGEIGISMGGNEPWGSLRFHDIRIRDNVFTDIGRTFPTNRDGGLSWGIEAQDWKGGAITGNLLIHQRAGIGNTYAIDVNASPLDPAVPSITASTEDVLVAHNTIANLWAGPSNALVLLRDGPEVRNVRFENNIVQSPSATPLASFTSGGYSLAGSNRYLSAAAPGNRFLVNGVARDLAGWIAATGDTGASGAAPVFLAPTRDLESYIAYLGLGSTFQHFIDALYGQSKASWNPALSAGAINDWLRAGFGMRKQGPPPGTRIESWRQSHFDTVENSGAAADTADFDGDGIANLMEYATGTDPTEPNPEAVLPGLSAEGMFLTLTFKRIADPSITYTVLAGDHVGNDLAVAAIHEGSTDDAVTYVDTVSLSGSGIRRFLRLRASYGEPSSWPSADIGAVSGSTVRNVAADLFTLRANGADIFGAADAFRYVIRDGGLQGDGEIVARVESIAQTHNWAKAGLMIRRDLAANAPNVAVLVSPNGSVSFQYRTAAGGSTITTTAAGLGAPRWLRLVRTGNSFGGYHSADGATWTQLGATAAVTMPVSVSAGLAVTAHNTSTLTTAVIGNVVVSP